MAYLKQATSRAQAVIPNDSANIPIVGSVAADGAGSSIQVNGGGGITGTALAILGLQYITPPTITVSTATGSGAVLTAVLDPITGAIASITINNAGTLYDAADVLVVSGGTFADAQPCVLYIGFTAAITEITVTTDGGDIVKFNNPAVGRILGGASPINVRKVWNTGTSAGFDTAGALIALW